ncbi:MAG: universal stress protein [Syntrophobacteraceae bacterium]
MYRSIIVPIDGSLTSLDALKQAFRIEKASITVVCAIPFSGIDLSLLDLQTLKTNVQEKLKQFCDTALDAAAEIARDKSASIETICEVGQPHEIIVKIAEERGCDLIVMGRRGLGRIERALTGSVTARVIGFSPIDVLVVPRDSSLGWKRIVLATDGSEFSKNATKRAMELVKASGGELKVVSATDMASEFHPLSAELTEKLCEWPRYCVSDVREQAVTIGVHPECIVRQAEAYKAILSVAEECGANLIVMGSHGRTGLKRLLMGSVAEKVIGYASCPVLIIKR